ncbi:MAG: hypothetical protein ACYCU8_15145 [Ferrimicrobium acidiphilum]|jgi:hypothetical protein
MADTADEDADGGVAPTSHESLGKVGDWIDQQPSSQAVAPSELD